MAKSKQAKVASRSKQTAHPEQQSVKMFPVTGTDPTHLIRDHIFTQCGQRRTYPWWYTHDREEVTCEVCHG